MSENRIRIILPVAESEHLDLSKDESIIYKLLKEEFELSRKEIDSKTGFDKSKTLRVLNRLADKKIIRKLGDGTAVIYRL